jgi:hypothetical protein
MAQTKHKDTRKIVFLEVHSGLCNRLRALVSGICLAEDLNSLLVVYWLSSEEACGAGFSDLYEPKSLPEWVKVIDGIPPFKGVECNSERQALQLYAKGCLIRSGNSFYSSDVHKRRCYLQHLMPRDFLLQRIRMNFHKHPKGLQPVGVHVRRTDNQRAIEESPLSGFESAMKKIPNGYFYLASDDDRSVSYLLRKFPGRVFCHETLRDRTSVEGVQEAVVSLYTLALCSKILGSYYSSFSKMAGQLRIVNVETIRKTI